MCVFGCVVMPEHVHLVVDEPEEILIKSGVGKSRFLDSLEMTMENLESQWYARHKVQRPTYRHLCKASHPLQKTQGAGHPAIFFRGPDRLTFRAAL
jgi:hypothetical protein